MGLLRSETMKYGMVVLPVSEGYKYVEALGRETACQFEDMNSRDMKRSYRKQIQRIDEVERILRVFFSEINASGMDFFLEKNKIDDFLENGNYKFDNIEAEMTKIYDHLVKTKENNSTLEEERNAAAEETKVVQTALRSLTQTGGHDHSAILDDSFETSAKQPMLDAEGGSRRDYAAFNCTAGTIDRKDQERFARALFRATRGNTFTHFENVDDKLIDPKSGTPVDKSVFVVYFQDVGAGAQSAMSNKVQKICQAFSVNVYVWPSSLEEANRRNTELKTTLADKTGLLTGFNQVLKNELSALLKCPRESSNSYIEDARLFCIKEKSIYATLNLAEGELLLRVNCWYPENDEDHIKNVLKSQNTTQGASLMPANKPAKQMPPTHVRKNEFTTGWQDVIDTYGVPRYQEANPALFACSTFPFIFGMMYGDIGHGTMLLCAGLFMCWNSDYLRYNAPGLFNARFMIVQMGVFAIYAGFMYNDLFSIGLELFDSAWKVQKQDGKFTNYEPNFDARNAGGPGPYPFGLDPMWHGSTNELLYVNSLKMKLSVLFGVLQMVTGVLLKWSNAVHEKNAVDFFCECIPMMVFMLCFFGWMDFMVLYKWVHPIDQPPSIINSLICMAMGQDDLLPLWTGSFSSVDLARKLMLATVISVPIMLIPKPAILWARNKSAAKSEHQALPGDEEAASAGGGGHGDHEEFEIGEVIIHQVIEVIEYVLGTVSHTASYLRIWALSLAHQQLSLVFFQKTIDNGFTVAAPWNCLVLYLLFGAWFGITCGVLLGMDVLECFLHTLRLHWVEFQSKFYKADGYQFAPYSIRTLITPVE